MIRAKRNRVGRGGTASSSRRVTASSAAKNFGALVDQVRETRATYVVERAGVPVAQIAPAPGARPTCADLVDGLRASGRLDERYLKEVEQGMAFLNEPSVPSNPWES
jgi:antitoxin (DNA-binding transcriptional repressor) of toxin-antitoxin stability system